MHVFRFVVPFYQVDCLTMKRKALHSLKISLAIHVYQLTLHNYLKLQQYSGEIPKYCKIKLSYYQNLFSAT
jgi:hypothetical protein